jgi:NMD protein affecting ribosome stability and mRNA decay
VTAAGQLVSVRRATDDTATCRRCGRTIERGRRIALVAGTGNMCLRCLISDRHRATTPDRSPQTSPQQGGAISRGVHHEQRAQHDEPRT